MIAEVKYPIVLILVFLWIGFVCAISFLEAWLKFRAPGITVSLGLGIGRLVFNALNKIEWVFAIAVFAAIFFSNDPVVSIENSLYFLPLILLCIQTFWLLPALDAIAELHIQGKSLPRSTLHYYYIGMELTKVVCLFIFGIKLFN
ncbi:MAG TPA: hypothetical protein VD908_19715 [Cytophagales bacterium]|nr:hypothetical protein [Cytophagales bacterium]